MKFKSDFCKVILVLILALFLINCKKDSSTASGSSGSITDIDGNIYHSVKIGTQVWMVENLKTTKYRNGDPIDNITNQSAWAALNFGGGAYCWYDNDALTNKATYGALYNWYAVSDTRLLAPDGWHIATDAEWTTLTTNLGGEGVASGKLKEAGTNHWLSPNIISAQSVGFEALPGGYRYWDGVFDGIRSNGMWWTRTPMSGTTFAIGRNLKNENATVGGVGDNKRLGFSVRCIRD